MPKHEGQNFEEQSTLGDLRLGFFNDINIPTYSGCFEITCIEIWIMMFFFVGKV